MLYVGFLQKPFNDAKLETLLIVALAFIVITAATVPIFLRWAQSIFMPLERVTATIGEVESGNLSARTKLPASADEIGRVAGHLDTLLDQIQERDRQLREWNRSEEHTSELQSPCNLVCRLLLEKKKNITAYRAPRLTEHRPVHYRATHRTTADSTAVLTL